MKLTLVQINSANDKAFAMCRKIYSESFPVHEQREFASQVRILESNEYKFEQVCEGDETVGLLMYWETEDFIYVEHFCITSEKRNLGYGHRTLSLLNEKNKTTILEIDPPVDEISRRRKQFYEQAGFCANNYKHIHPPYRAGFNGHDLVVMSSPGALTEEEYSKFYHYLCETVMIGSCGED